MQCKQCGAELPEEARFCLHCGAPVQRSEEPPPATQSSEGPPPELDFMQPALAGGTALAVLSSIPVVNCLCCMWVLGGGGLATYMLSKQQPGRRLTYGDGAFAGVLSGLFGAIIYTILSIPLKLAMAPFLRSQQDQFEQMLRNLPEMEGWLRDLMIKSVSPEVSVAGILFTFFSNLITYALFAMIGGILTVAILQKRGARPVGQAPPR
jgi:zinc ribbon protein